MALKKKSGQILVLVLLVVVVALAVGLSAASRNLTNLRSSTQTEQSQRAFTSAEGGVESVLPQLDSLASSLSQPSGTTIGTRGNCQSAGDGKTANCTLDTSTSVNGNVKVVAVKSYEKPVELSDVAQVHLDGYANHDLSIDWVKTGDSAQVVLEFIFICQGGATCMGDPIANGYGQHREVYKNPVATYVGQSNISTNCTDPGGSFDCRASFNFPAGSNVKMLRIKPFWNRTTIKLTPSDEAAFPAQTYEITSTATTDTGVSRKVEVRRDVRAQLPSVFDYVLYSGSDIVK